MDVQPFADNLREAYLDAKLEQARKPRPHYTNHPHSAGHPCARYLVLLRVAWGLQIPLADRIKAALFAEGHHQEHALVSDLRALSGYRVELQHVPVELPDLEVVGEWDFCLQAPAALRAYVADGKAVSPGIFRALNRVEDLLTHRRHFVRMWPVQLLLYLEAAVNNRMLGARINPDVALLILKDKVTGDIKPIAIPWDQEIMDHVHERLRQINAIVAMIRRTIGQVIGHDLPPDAEAFRKALPVPLADHAVCPGCPYYTFCQPEMLFPALGHAEVLDDPDVEAALEIVDKNREAHTEFTHTYDDLKALLDRHPITFSDRDRAYLVVGPFLVTVLRIAPRGRPEYRKYDIWKRPDAQKGA